MWGECISKCIDAEFLRIGEAFYHDTTIDYLRVAGRNVRESGALDEGSAWRARRGVGMERDLNYGSVQLNYFSL